MIIFPVDKKQFLKLLLATYFLIFSISPLTYTLSDKQVSESFTATHNNSSSIKSVHILLWEFFIERLSSKEENSHTDGNASVLIKKKRALASENAYWKLPLFKNTSMVKDCYNPLAPTTYSLNVISAKIPGICKGFNPLYAGNSPPSA